MLLTVATTYYEFVSYTIAFAASQENVQYLYYRNYNLSENAQYFYCIVIIIAVSIENCSRISESKIKNISMTIIVREQSDHSRQCVTLNGDK